MRIPDPKANTTTEAYLAYKAGFLEESELKPVLYEPYLHFDAWLAYWAGLTSDYPKKYGKNLCRELSGFSAISSNGATDIVTSENSVSFTTTANGTGVYMSSNNGNNYEYCPELYSTGYVCSVEVSATKASQLQFGIEGRTEVIDVGTTPKRYSFKCYGNAGERVVLIFYRRNTSGECSYTISNIQVEKGVYATDYEPYGDSPEMLTDEEALVAYLSGVTDTYPEEIKDPYDVRIVGYLKYLVSARWGRPEYPVNNEEFYLSTMKPAFIPSGDPSSSIDLDGTAEAPFLDLKMYGDTYQNSYSGKNLSTNISTYTYGLNGNASASISGSTLSITIITGVSGAGVYFSRNSNATNHPECYTAGNVVSFTVSSNATGKISVGFEGGGQVVFDTSPTPIRCSFLTQSTGNWVIYQSGNYSNVTYEISEFQIEEGSTATDYEPYVGGVPAPNPDYPQDVNIVTGEQVVSVVGKNLYNKDGTNILSAYIDFTHQSITSIANNRIIWIKCKPSTTYTVSKLPMNNQRGIAYTTELPAVGVQTYGYRAGVNGWSSLDFTTGADAEYLVIRIWSSAQDTETLETMLASVQIEEGSTATDYEPYQGANYTINLGSTELCKVYKSQGQFQDYIYRDGEDWYLHKENGELVFDGTEDWSYDQNYSRVVLDNIPNIIPSRARELRFFCSHFIVIYDRRPVTSVNVNECYAGAGSLYIHTSMTLADFKAFLATQYNAGTPVKIVYPLNTATDTQITDSELIDQLDALMEGGSYEGDTHIRVSANDPNLPGLLYVEAAKYD